MSDEAKKMLSPLTKIARKVLDRRVLLKLSQRDVARAVGCSQSYICQIETGRRTISLAVAKKLEIALDAKSGAYRKAEFRRGARLARQKPAQFCAQSLRLGALRRVRSQSWETPPSQARSHFTIDNPYWPIAQFLGAESQREVTRLEKERKDEEHFWRKMNTLSFQSWTEKRFQVRVGLTGAELLGVSSRRLGTVLPTACGQTGRDASRKAYPTFLLQDQDLSVAIIPQRCVGTSQTYRWADSLVVAARQRRKVTAVIETDGAEYHQDRAKDQRRDKELDVPVLRIDAGDVGKEGLVARLLVWLRNLLP